MNRQNSSVRVRVRVNNSHAAWTSVVHIICAVIRGTYMDLVSPVTIQVFVWRKNMEGLSVHVCTLR